MIWGRTGLNLWNNPGIPRKGNWGSNEAISEGLRKNVSCKARQLTERRDVDVFGAFNPQPMEGKTL